MPVKTVQLIQQGQCWGEGGEGTEWGHKWRCSELPACPQKGAWKLPAKPAQRRTQRKTAERQREERRPPLGGPPRSADCRGFTEQNGGEGGGSGTPRSDSAVAWLWSRRSEPIILASQAFSGILHSFGTGMRQQMVWVWARWGRWKARVQRGKVVVQGGENGPRGDGSQRPFLNHGKRSVEKARTGSLFPPPKQSGWFSIYCQQHTLSLKKNKS